MKLKHLLHATAAGALLCSAIGAGAVAVQSQAQTPAALGGIQRGLWELRLTGGGSRKVCVTNPRMLLQLRHGGTKCEQIVMENAPGRTTVRYTCAGHGQGRTVLIVETPILIRIDNQGVADGSPFAEEYEGRRVGNCG